MNIRIYELFYFTDARRFELQQTCGFAESDESPINIHVLRLYVFIKRGTDARRFELQQPMVAESDESPLYRGSIK